MTALPSSMRPLWHPRLLNWLARYHPAWTEVEIRSLRRLSSEALLTLVYGLNVDGRGQRLDRTQWGNGYALSMIVIYAVGMNTLPLTNVQFARMVGLSAARVWQLRVATALRLGRRALRAARRIS